MLKKPEIVALEWQSWPLRQQGLRPRAVAVLLLVCLVWLVLLASLPTLSATALGLALTISLFPYYLPTHYRVDEDGITINRNFGPTRQRKWSEFSRCQMLSNGYLLTPHNTPERLQTFRALWLPAPTDPATRQLLTNLLSYLMSVLTTN